MNDEVLVDAVRDNRNLYDLTLPVYRNFDVKESSWRVVAERT
jgi:hypothetical protein